MKVIGDLVGAGEAWLASGSGAGEGTDKVMLPCLVQTDCSRTSRDQKKRIAWVAGVEILLGHLRNVVNSIGEIEYCV